MEEDKNVDGVQTEVQTEEEGTEWVDVTDLFEGEEETPTKEQILEGARKENEKGDERERQDLIKANSIAMSAGLFIAGIIIIVSVFVKDVFPYEVMMITCGMQAAQNLFVGVRNCRLRKLYFTVGIIEAICAVTFSVVWVLNLCGVII